MTGVASPPAPKASDDGLGSTGVRRGVSFSVFAAVLGAYAAQGFGYATLATALPAFKDRVGLSETVLSVLLLGMCFAAALGSIVADLIAVRAGSRWALAVGFAAQAGSVVVAATVTSLPVFAAALAVYGVGLGAVDAASNMQCALAQAKSSVPVFGKLYAGYTIAAIIGALVTSAVRSTDLPPTITLGGAAAVLIVAALMSGRYCDPFVSARIPGTGDGSSTVPLPRAGIWLIGALIFVAFTVDSAVSAWSSIYMQDGLGAVGALAPLGYAAYLAVVLVGRLAADPMVRRWGRRLTGFVGVVVAAIGCVLVAAVHLPGAAILGFAAAGTAAGLLVPVAFSRAGELLPVRSDEVIARVNIFNYGGAVVGAVALGLFAADASALAYGFLLPAVALLAALPLLRGLASAPT